MHINFSYPAKIFLPSAIKHTERADTNSQTLSSAIYDANNRPVYASHKCIGTSRLQQSKLKIAKKNKKEIYSKNIYINTKSPYIINKDKIVHVHTHDSSILLSVHPYSMCGCCTSIHNRIFSSSSSSSNHHIYDDDNPNKIPYNHIDSFDRILLSSS